ncbi:hypothetical protein PSN45_003974 [Yamadazyma tenuis]|uniref:F-box domain-containing protein n=1 Tax=Candida tenuis (strain ATCC 10573 / BCRC 21748 / CBS 615 / JCM 9827 / NBRC 10315 / NRRL Y-1498 / VKM Y-70) TaxID=590646 RepID=G3B4C4_CANTC|nr:uncharacterized protein CANTEDRAFT_113974 [Yamadazyma tenuis ATCC 10573]EGV63950.1 hypothetical protein CANTEDRAFT_113974 [Yamadazyma tenuis ATCC 10573]WEJ96435.1 hypothetical protein PSN45_003974 [Yamadazyma tenuis]
MGFVNIGKPYNYKRSRDRQPKKHKPVEKTLQLTKLPIELLFNIFCYASVSENNLALVNRYFYKLFRPANLGLHYLQKFIQCRFVVDLNNKCTRILSDIDEMFEEFDSGSELREIFDPFKKSLNYIKTHQWGFNIDAFKYRFTYELDAEYFKQFCLISSKHISTEQAKRLRFIHNQLRLLQYQLQRWESRQQHRHRYDWDFSETILPLRHSTELLLTISEEPLAVLSEDDYENERAEIASGVPVSNIDAIYNSDFGAVVEEVYPTINSMNQFHKVVVLIDALGMKFKDKNNFMITIIDGNLQFKDKTKILKYMHKTFFQKAENSPSLSVSFILKLFQLLSSSSYDAKFEKVVHKFLRHFYGTGDDLANFDLDLWNYIKEAKDSDLFQILCGYSTPSFTL